MPFSGIFGICGQAKENALGTVTPPTKFRRYISPFDFNTDKTPIISEAISGVADLKKKWAEGPALLKGGYFRVGAIRRPSGLSLRDLEQHNACATDPHGAHLRLLYRLADRNGCEQPVRILIAAIRVGGHRR